MTRRLMDILIARWAEIDGFAAGQGLGDLEEMSQERLDNFVWWFVTKDAVEQTEVDKFKNRLWQPPVGSTAPIPKNSPWSPENEQAAFASLKGALGLGGPKPTASKSAEKT